MAVGKRSGTDQPLTEHDVAERFSNALLRVWRIASELQEDPEMWEQVKHSRYLVVLPSQVTETLSTLR